MLSGLKRFKTQTIEYTFLSAYVWDVIYFYTKFKKENNFNDYLNSGESSNNGGGTKTVSDHWKMSQMALNAWIQDLLWPGVAKGTTILI